MVRIQVDGETAEYLGQLTGATSPTREFEGEVVRSSPDTLWMTMTVATAPNPMGREVIGQRVILARARITNLELRQIDWTRTGIVSGVGAAAVVVAAVKIFSGAFGGSTIGSPPGPVDIRLPVSASTR
jgi:hypothetical protein